MWTFPARFLVEFFANHGMLGFAKRPQWRTVVGGSRSYVDAVIAAVARPPAARHADHARSTARRGRRDRHAARRRARALRRGRAGHALRPGAGAAAPTRPTASTRSSARSRTSATRPCCTPTAALLPRRRRAWASWNYHLLPEPTGLTTVTYHMNRLQALDADREFCVTLNRIGRDRPGQGPAHDLLRAPGVHPRGRPRAGPPRRDQRRATARTTPARTGAGASTRTAWPARCAWPSASEAPVTSDVRGHDPAPPLRGARARLQAPDRAGLRGPADAAAAADYLGHGAVEELLGTLVGRSGC